MLRYHEPLPSAIVGRDSGGLGCLMGQPGPEVSELVEANQRFYDAFSALDIEAMANAWETSERARCLHPGWPLITGWEPIRESWETIFNNTTMMHFIITEVKPEVQGDLGWVDCVENITSVVDGKASSFAVRATNLFSRHEGRWLVVHHHASG